MPGTRAASVPPEHALVALAALLGEHAPAPPSTDEHAVLRLRVGPWALEAYADVGCCTSSCDDGGR